MQSHEQAGLCSYFDKSYPRPWGQRILFSADTTADVGTDVAEALDLTKVAHVGTVQHVYRKLTLSYRYRLAAWLFLQPRPPLWDPKKLAKRVGADHINLATFVGQLADECNEVIRKHPSLTAWIYRRLGALDWILVRRRADRSRRDEAFECRNALDSWTALFQRDPAASVVGAKEVCALALVGAGNAAVDAIADAAGFSANLMIKVPAAATTSIGESLGGCHSRADALWAEAPTHGERLIAVAETPGAGHLGFWVPVLPRNGDLRIPGACEAISGTASLVMKADLPPLHGLSDGMKDTWKRYMEGEFQHDLFLSLPVRVPRAHQPVGVLNINVNAKSEALHHWYRAYSEDWSTQAEEYASEFMDLALRALRIVFQRRDEKLAINLGVPSLQLVDGGSHQGDSDE